jgi:hypothetical protein
LLSLAKKAAAFPRISFSILSTRFSRRSTDELGAFLAGQAFASSFVDVGLAELVPKTTVGNPEIGRDLRDRLYSLTSELDGPATELRRVWTWHSDSLSRRASPPQGRCPSNRGKLTSVPSGFLP